MKLFKRPTIYISHPILGSVGEKGKNTNIMETNCAKAIRVVSKLRKVFPDVDFYVPAESDRIIQVLYRDNVISNDDILNADLKIVDSCNGWIFLKWDESGGSRKEEARAKENNIVYPGSIIIDDVSKMSYHRIRKRLESIVDSTLKHYKENK